MLNISILSGDEDYVMKIQKMASEEYIVNMVFAGNNYIKYFSKSIATKTDILILDKDFGNVHLFTLIQKVKQSNPKTLILHVVDSLDGIEWPSLLSSGVNGILRKKMKKSEIFANLVTLQESGALLQAEVAKEMLNYFASKAETTGDISLKKTSINVLHLLSEGCSYVEISEKLGISLDGVRYHIKLIYKSLGVSNKGAAIAMYLKGQVAV